MRFSQETLRKTSAERSSRVGRVVLVGMAALFALIGVAFVAFYYLTNGGFAGWGVLQSSLLFFLGIFVIVLVGIARLTGASATTVGVDDVGVVFEYPKGRTWKVLWSDPRFDFYFGVIGDKVEGGGVVSSRICAVHPSANKRSYVTAMVYRAVIQQARVQGFEVTEGLPDRYPWKRTRFTRDSEASARPQHGVQGLWAGEVR